MLTVLSEKVITELQRYLIVYHYLREAYLSVKIGMKQQKWKGNGREQRP